MEIFPGMTDPDSTKKKLQFNKVTFSGYYTKLKQMEKNETTSGYWP